MLALLRCLGLILTTLVVLPGSAASAELGTSAQKLAELIQSQRAAARIDSLRTNASLSQAAQAHAENMAAKNEFTHELDGLGPGDRAVAHGYPSRVVGETIAWQHMLSPERALETWWGSELHRTILLGDYRDFGVAVAHRPDGPYYWVVVVGNRR